MGSAKVLLKSLSLSFSSKLQLFHLLNTCISKKELGFQLLALLVKLQLSYPAVSCWKVIVGRVGFEARMHFQ